MKSKNKNAFVYILVIVVGLFLVKDYGLFNMAITALPGNFANPELALDGHDDTYASMTYDPGAFYGVSSRYLDLSMSPTYIKNMTFTYWVDSQNPESCWNNNGNIIWSAQVLKNSTWVTVAGPLDTGATPFTSTHSGTYPVNQQDVSSFRIKIDLQEADVCTNAIAHFYINTVDFGICEDTFWLPDLSQYCSTISITQTSNCGATRIVPGAINCTVNAAQNCTVSSWSPSDSYASQVCSNTTFAQLSNCNTTKVMSGTKNCTAVQANTSCTPNCACASSIYTTSTCSNGCGGTCTGTLTSTTPTGPVPTACQFYEESKDGACSISMGYLILGIVLLIIGYSYAKKKKWL